MQSKADKMAGYFHVGAPDSITTRRYRAPDFVNLYAIRIAGLLIRRDLLAERLSIAKVDSQLNSVLAEIEVARSNGSTVKAMSDSRLLSPCNDR